MVFKEKEEILPLKPVLFDKSKLSSDEYKNYLYEIEFKKSGKKVRDMSLNGYIHAINPYLKSIESEVIQFGWVGERKVMSAVVKATVTISYRSSTFSTGVTNEMKFSALADGDATAVPSVDVLVRTVETRALKRAIARALDISKTDFNEDFVEEEECGTPMGRGDDSSDESVRPRSSAFPGGKTPKDIADAKKRRIEEAEKSGEGDW